MNIAFVNATRKWGGVKTWYLQFAELLSQRGNRVFSYARQPEFVTQVRERAGHGEEVHFGADLNPATVAFFLREFRKRSIDIVIVNIEKELSTAGVAAKLLGIPVVQRVGLPGDIPCRLKTRLLHRWIRPRFLCPCRYIADGFVRSLPYVRSEDVHVILNGKKATDTPLETHSPRRLIATQQLQPDKGHETLLRALALIGDMSFELHVWGVGKSEEALQRLSRELGLGERVFWHGFSFNIMGELQTGDVFLLASLREGLPNTQLEAMAAGLLPIVRNVGGVREVIPDSLRNWVLPYEADARAFAERIKEALVLSDKKLVELRNISREACRDLFDIDCKADELECWMKDLLT